MTEATITDPPIPKPNQGFLIKYDLKDETMEDMRNRFALLKADTSDGYKMVVRSLAEIREWRGAIEKRRKELKEDSLAWGRAVDAEAKRLTGFLIALEDPLKIEKAKADAEKDRLRREKEEVELRALEAKLRAEREAEEERLRLLREAEEARLAELRKEEEKLRVENERTMAEWRERMEAERKAADAERKALDDQRRVMEEQQRQLATQEAERQAKIDKEAADFIAAGFIDLHGRENGRRDLATGTAQEANKNLKTDVEVKNSEKEAKEHDAMVKEALELGAVGIRAMTKSDVEEIRDFAAAIRAIHIPTVVLEEPRMAVWRASRDLAAVAKRLDDFLTGLGNGGRSRD